MSSIVEKVNVLDVVELARAAGAVIMQVYAKDFAVEFKGDESPLTEADRAAHEVIESGLLALNESLQLTIPILSEEGKSIPYSERAAWTDFWLVDPLDGTKEFVKKNGEFTVNIALISNGVPVLGVVYAPALNIMYWAKQGEGAFKEGQRLPLAVERESYHIVASRSHMSDETKDFINAIETDKNKELVSIGSSLKICLVAEGVADVYPRLGPTMEWDTGAAHAIVTEVGKSLMSYSLEQGYATHVYNKENLLNPWFVVR